MLADGLVQRGPVVVAVRCSPRARPRCGGKPDATGIFHRSPRSPASLRRLSEILSPLLCRTQTEEQPRSRSSSVPQVTRGITVVAGGVVVPRVHGLDPVSYTHLTLPTIYSV